MFCIVASNSHRGGNRLHSEYYIFIHTFVYDFAFSLNSHIVCLCYIVQSITFFVHKSKTVPIIFMKLLLRRLFFFLRLFNLVLFVKFF